MVRSASVFSRRAFCWERDNLPRELYRRSLLVEAMVVDPG